MFADAEEGASTGGDAPPAHREEGGAEWRGVLEQPGSLFP